MVMISLRAAWLQVISKEKVYHDEMDIAENMILDEHEEYLAYISRYKHEWEEYRGFDGNELASELKENEEGWVSSRDSSSSGSVEDEVGADDCRNKPSLRRKPPKVPVECNRPFVLLRLHFHPLLKIPIFVSVELPCDPRQTTRSAHKARKVSSKSIPSNKGLAPLRLLMRLFRPVLPKHLIVLLILQQREVEVSLTGMV